MSVSTRALDALDRQLLNIIQRSFPIAPRPFAELAAELRTTEDDVLARLRALKDDRIVRQISMIFDTRALGYRSSLVATRVPRPGLDEAASVVNAHPGVSHNYRRDHAFNLWWTIAVPPSSSLERHVQRLHDLCGAESTRIMHTIRLFKIGVDLDMTGERAPDAKSTLPAWRAAEAGPPLTDAEIAMLRELQEDISLETAPFASMAARIGIPEDEILDGARRFVAEGRARRYAAVLHHRNAGFVANAMSVWAVPEDRVEEVGGRMAGFAAVSHCYQRPTYPDWPYNVFGMLHGRSKADCEASAESIAREVGVADRAMLYSTKEYKKVRVRYFTPELGEWERRFLDQG